MALCENGNRIADLVQDKLRWGRCRSDQRECFVAIFCHLRRDMGEEEALEAINRLASGSAYDWNKEFEKIGYTYRF
jgi:hypothetical protein